MIILTILVICLLVAIAGAVAGFFILLTSSAVVFSRVAFALLAALIASSTGAALVPNSGFLNYAAWAIVFLGIIYLLSTLPRVDRAMRFFCSVLMSVLVIWLVAMLLGSIIIKGFQLTAFYEILLKAVCLLCAFGTMAMQTKKAAYDSPTNMIGKLLERLLASLMYGIAITFLCVSLNGNWDLPGLLYPVILLVSTAVAFAADKLLAGKHLFGITRTEEVSMPK